MKKSFLFLFSALLLGQSLLYAQEIEDTKNYSPSIGYGYIIPSMKNGIHTGPWQTINWRNRWFEVYYAAGDVNFLAQPVDINPTHAYGMSLGMGLHIPFLKHTLGERANGGFMLNPTLDIDAGIMGVNNRYGLYYGTSLTMAPGVDIHLPLFYISASLCFTYNIFLDDPNSGYAIAPAVSDVVGYLGLKGFMIYPKLTFQLNSMSHVVNPRKVLRGEVYDNLSGYKSQTNVTERSSSGALHDYIVYSDPVYQGSWRDINSRIVSSYVGFKCGAEFQRVRETKGTTFLPFAGLVLRAGPIAVDAAEAWGKIGMDSPAFATLKNNYEGNILSAVGAVDIANLISTLCALRFKIKNDDTKRGDNRHAILDTRKFRLLMGYRFSFVNMHPVINSGNAVPANSVNSINQPYNPVSYNFNYTRNFHFAVEISTISLFWDVLPPGYYPYASGNMFGLSWHLPIKIWHKG